MKYDWKEIPWGSWKHPGRKKVRPQGKGARNDTLLSPCFTYFIWFGSGNESCAVGLIACLTDEGSKIQRKVGEAVILRQEGQLVVGQGSDRVAGGLSRESPAQLCVWAMESSFLL